MSQKKRTNSEKQRQTEENINRPNQPKHLKISYRKDKKSLSLNLSPSQIYFDSSPLSQNTSTPKYQNISVNNNTRSHSLKEVPTIPDQTPNKKYNVPMSL